MQVSKTDVNENPAIAQQATALPARARPRGLRVARRFGQALPGLAFFLGMIAIVHALAYVASTVAPDFNTRFLQVDRQHVAGIMASADTIDALALGNSHAGSLHMPALGFENGYRFARADGDLFETQSLIRYLAPRLPQMEVVLIPISYFSFLEENTASPEVSVRREHLYASLPTWQFSAGDLKPFLIGKSHVYLPVGRLIREDNWEGVFYALLGRPAEQKGFIEVEAGDCSSLNAGQLSASAENRVAKYMRLNHEMRANHPGLAEDAYNTLTEITRYLQRRGVRVVFFTPPYWQGYNELYQAEDADTIRLMRSSMARLQRELGVEYYDFAQDPDFARNPALFKDSDHLNSCGAEQFSRQLAQAIETRQAAQP